MRHEKIIENELNGTRIKIEVEATFYYATPYTLTYDFEISVQEKGKRVWKPAVDTMSKEYRQLSLSQRGSYIQNQNESFVSPAEILAAKMELWEKIKPE